MYVIIFWSFILNFHFRYLSPDYKDLIREPRVSVSGNQGVSKKGVHSNFLDILSPCAFQGLRSVLFIRRIRIHSIYLVDPDPLCSRNPELERIRGHILIKT